MPVIEHEVHDRTREKAGAVYGCHGRPRRRDPLMVKQGLETKGLHAGRMTFVRIPDFGSLECRYDRSLTDAKCEGCQHRGSGEAYAEHVRANGA